MFLRKIVTFLLSLIAVENGIVERDYLNDDGYWIFNTWYVRDADKILLVDKVIKNLACEECVNRYRALLFKPVWFCQKKVPGCFWYNSENDGCRKYERREDV